MDVMSVNKYERAMDQAL